MHDIIIALDGWSSCGKSTLARELAHKLAYGYIDTGAMYRAVTLYFINNKIALDDDEAITLALQQITISFQQIEGENHTFLNDLDVEKEIRLMEVSSLVSEVAAISRVRRSMVGLQQQMGIHKRIVMDGRDIGTVVFPAAELKIFLTADPEIRAQRRFQELKDKGKDTSLKAVKENLAHRDHIDSTREDSPLKQAEDAILLDNSTLSKAEQLDLVLEWANQRINRQSAV